MKKTVSVIIPAYNASKTIIATIESVLCQSYQDFQVIVIDDGSTDGTEEIIKEHFGNKVIILKKKNGGVSSARNLGIAHAQSEFIAFLDADDYWYPEKLEIQINTMKKLPDCALCYADVAIGDTCRTRGFSYPVFTENKWTAKDVFEKKTICNFSDKSNRSVDVYYGNLYKSLAYNGMILPSTVLVKKSLLEETGVMWDESNSLAEDSEYFLLLSRNTQFAYIDQPLTKYLDNNADNRLSHKSNIPLRMHLFLKTLEREKCQNKQLPNELRQWITFCISRLYRRLGYFHFTEMQPVEARDALIRGIARNPLDIRSYLYLGCTFIPIIILKYIQRYKALKKNK